MVAVLQLVQQGRLTLSDTEVTHLTGFAGAVVVDSGSRDCRRALR